MFKKKSAFAEIYNDYYPLVFSTVNSSVCNITDTEDICQEVFFRLYEKYETIVPEKGNVRKWLYGALRIEVLAYFRKKKGGHESIDDVFDDIGLTYVNGFRDLRIVVNEIIEDIGSFRDDIEKILFDLIAVYNYTYEEAGSHLGLSKRQVRYRYGLIVDNIFKSLSERGINSLEDLL
jgi:RNA polymerase sigma factor (sigma-70 family)